MPFKWSNIQAPDFTGAANILQAGGNNLNEAINTLSNVAKNLNQQQIDAQKASLVQQALANASDPEQLNNFFKSASSNPAFNKLRSGDWMQVQQFQNNLLNTNKLQGEVADALWARNTKKDTANFASAIKAAIASGDPNKIAQANLAMQNYIKDKNYDPSQIFFGNENEAKQNNARLANLVLDNRAKQQALDNQALKSKLAAEYYAYLGNDPDLMGIKAHQWLQNIGINNKDAFTIAEDIVKSSGITPQRINMVDPNMYTEALAQKGAIAKETYLNNMAKDLTNASGEIVNLNIKPTTKNDSPIVFGLNTKTTKNTKYTSSTLDPKQNLISRLTEKSGVTINGKFIPITKDNIDDFEIVPTDNPYKFIAKFKPEVVKEILEKESTNFRANPLENTLEENQNRLNAISSYAGNKLITNSRAGSVIKDFNSLLAGLENAKPHEVVTMVANSLKNSGYDDANVDYVADALKDINNALPENLRNRVPMNVLALAFLSTLDPEESLVPWQIWGNNGEAPENEINDAVQFISSYANNPNAFSELMSREEYYTNLINNAKTLKTELEQNNSKLKKYTYAYSTASSEKDKFLYYQLLRVEKAKQIQLLLQLVELEAKQRGY